MPSFAYAPAVTSTVAPIVVIGTQTLAISSPITLSSGSTAEVLSLATDSTGGAEIIAGSSTIPLASYAAAAAATDRSTSTVHVAVTSTVTGPPVYITVGLLTVSQNSAGAYLLGSETLTVGETVTEGSGTATAIIAIETSNGSTEVVVEGAATTTSMALPKMSTITSVITSTQTDHSIIVVAGHTYSISVGGNGTATRTGPSNYLTFPASSATASTEAILNAAGGFELNEILLGAAVLATGLIFLL